jgi:hypothetical protein
MLRKLRPRSVYDVLAAVAFFAALGTGGAYAANTVFSEDIVDGEVKTPDLAAGAVTNRKLAENAVGSGKVADDSLEGRDVRAEALKGEDINEPTLGTVPNSDKLDDIDSTGFPRIVARASVERNYPSIAGNDCISDSHDFGDSSSVLSSDLTIVQEPGDDFPEDLLLHGINALFTPEIGTPGAPDPPDQRLGQWKVCNASAAAINPPDETFTVVVLRVFPPK